MTEEDRALLKTINEKLDKIIDRFSIGKTRANIIDMDKKADELVRRAQKRKKILAVIIILGAGGVLNACNTPQASPAPSEKIIHPKLIAAIIHVESRGNPKAVSNRGAIGLCQVRPEIWSEELKKAGIIQHKSDLYEPNKNIAAGKFILAYYLQKNNGNITKALTSYSGGAKGYENKVRKFYQEPVGRFSD